MKATSNTRFREERHVSSLPLPKPMSKSRELADHAT